MKALKKAVVFALAATMVMGTVACGKNDDTPAKKPQAEQGEKPGKEPVKEPVKEELVVAQDEMYLYEEVADGLKITGCRATASDVEAFRIPEEIDGKPVVEIGEDAFDDYSGVKEIIIPDSVKKIGDRAFMYASDVVELIIGNGVESIGEEAFSDLESLKKLVIPSSVKEVDDYGFCNCFGLEQVEWNGVIETVPFCMLGNAYKLQTVTLPEGTKTIEEEAFAGCEVLKEAHLPGSVTQIASDAFEDASELTIYAPAGSYAETFAKENGIAFQAE